MLRMDQVHVIRHKVLRERASIRQVAPIAQHRMIDPHPACRRAVGSGRALRKATSPSLAAPQASAVFAKMSLSTTLSTIASARSFFRRLNSHRSRRVDLQLCGLRRNMSPW
jgi:hypothetical protein